MALGACAAGPHAPRPPPVLAEYLPAAGQEGDPRLQFIGAATAMVGQPYRWGGSAPGGFDCSGLVAFAAAAANVWVPRTAHEQMRAGTDLARAAVDKGDLVFMRFKRKELHVGIALDRTHFVHAPSSGGYVRIDSLDAAPYAQSFITARRILTAEQRAALP